MWRTLYLFFITVWLGCTQLSTGRPMCEATFDEELPTDTSYLSTPIIIPTQLIEDKMNAAIKADLLTDDDFENRDANGKKDRLKVRVKRMGNIKVSWKNNTATYQAPLQVLIEKEIISRKALPLMKSLAVKTEFSLRLIFETTVNVGEDWRIQPKTHFRNFEWLSEVRALGGLINVKKPVERRLRREMPEAEKTLDSLIRANVRLDRTMRRIWQKIQKPVIINRRAERVWLQFHPIQLEMGRILTEDSNLLIEARLTATTSTLIGDTTGYKVDSVLPRLVKRDSLPDEGYVHLVSQIPYTEINEVLQEKVVGKSLAMQGRKVHISAAEVWGCGHNLMVHLTIRGGVHGEVYFQGKPEYEADSQQIVIRDFDYEVRSSEALLAGADWLLHSTFKEKIAEQMSFPLQAKIELMPALIELGIERGKAGRKIDMSVEDWEFKPQQLCVRQFDLAIAVVVEARARIELEKI